MIMRRPWGAVLPATAGARLRLLALACACRPSGVAGTLRHGVPRRTARSITRRRAKTIERWNVDPLTARDRQPRLGDADARPAPERSAQGHRRRRPRPPSMPPASSGPPAGREGSTCAARAGSYDEHTSPTTSAAAATIRSHRGRAPAPATPQHRRQKTGNSRSRGHAAASGGEAARAPQLML